MNTNKLKMMYEKYSNSIETVAKEVIKELKNGSESYSEILNKLELVELILIWEQGDNEAIRAVISYAKELLNKDINQIIATLSWRCANNYKSALRYDKETETILIDEDRLMEVIQVITPIQKKRNIKLVKGLINNVGI